jgi:ATPase subunit of ABC transporter with duplicated ATPase domains
MMHQLKNKAEKSNSKLKGIHTEKIDGISKDISKFRKELPEIDEMKMNFENTSIYIGKTLVKAHDINFKFGSQKLWSKPVSLQIKSGDRISIDGNNGSGKTTLIKLILGDYQPFSGTIKRSRFKAVYVDQEYSLVDNSLTVYEQAQKYNDGALQKHEIKIRLFRYLFDRDSWAKTCTSLSGGEKMKLALCCLMISNKAPDIFALDEPTNNLDIQNIEILTSAVKNYKGTVIIVSHDTTFLKDISINRKITIENGFVKFPDL